MTKTLSEFLKYHQDQSQAQQATLLTHLTKVFADNANAQPQHPAGDSEYRMETLGQAIVEFEYDADNGITFDAWYLRYETLFTEDAASLTDAAKTRLLLRKLSTRCHSLYINSILPLTPKDNTFANTVLQLKNIFGRQESLFSLRYKCLQVAKSDIEDFNAYAASVNKHCEDFKLAELTADQFKCLVFVCGLQSSQYEAVRMKLLSTIDGPDAANVKLQSLVTECHRIARLKKDTALIEVHSVNGINRKPRSDPQNTQNTHTQEKQTTHKQHDQQKQKNKNNKNNITSRLLIYMLNANLHAEQRQQNIIKYIQLIIKFIHLMQGQVEMYHESVAFGVSWSRADRQATNNNYN